MKTVLTLQPGESKGINTESQADNPVRGWKWGQGAVGPHEGWGGAFCSYRRKEHGQRPGDVRGGRGGSLTWLGLFGVDTVFAGRELWQGLGQGGGWLEGVGGTSGTMAGGGREACFQPQESHALQGENVQRLLRKQKRLGKALQVRQSG